MRSIPRATGQDSISFCPASGHNCPGEMAGHAGKRWQSRSRWVRRNSAPWACTNWPPWGAPGDRPGTGPSTPGDAGSQASRGDPGQHPGRRGQQATDLPGDAGTTAGRKGGGPEGTLPIHQDQDGPLPFQRTLDQFDFAFQPSIYERQIKELAGLAFVAEASNILLLGPPGVGQTHLAVALANKAIENGYGSYFVRAYDLMENLRKARANPNLIRSLAESTW